MLQAVKELSYVILLVDDLDKMKEFYLALFPFEVRGDGDTGLGFNTGKTLFSLRKRTRDYDGKGPRLDAPGVQLAFLVEPAQVDECHKALLEHGAKIVEAPTDQPRGHRTLYFYDPEHNLLEVYAEI